MRYFCIKCHLEQTLNSNYGPPFLPSNALVITGIFLASNIDRKPMLHRIEEGVNNIFHNPTDAFYTGRAMDVLFYGVEYDCSVKDTYTSAICSALEDDKSVRKVDDDHYTFTMLGGVSVPLSLISSA